MDHESAGRIGRCPPLVREFFTSRGAIKCKSLDDSNHADRKSRRIRTIHSPLFLQSTAPRKVYTEEDGKQCNSTDRPQD